MESIFLSETIYHRKDCVMNGLSLIFLSPQVRRFSIYWIGLSAMYVSNVFRSGWLGTLARKALY